MLVHVHTLTHVRTHIDQLSWCHKGHICRETQTRMPSWNSLKDGPSHAVWSSSLAVMKAGGAQDSAFSTSPAGSPEREGHWMACRRDTIMALKGFVHECVGMCTCVWLHEYVHVCVCMPGRGKCSPDLPYVRSGLFPKVEPSDATIFHPGFRLLSGKMGLRWPSRRLNCSCTVLFFFSNMGKVLLFN